MVKALLLIVFTANALVSEGSSESYSQKDTIREHVTTTGMPQTETKLSKQENTDYLGNYNENNDELTSQSTYDITNKLEHHFKLCECHESLKIFRKASDDLGLNFLNVLAESDLEKMVIGAPKSLIVFLAILQLASFGSTKLQLAKATNVFDDDELLCALIEQDRYEKSLKPGVISNDAVVVAADDSYTFRDDYKKIVKDVLGQAITVDFTNGTKSRNVINKALVRLTNELEGHPIVSANAINKKTQLVYAGKWIFVTNWKKAFNPDTKCRPFFVTSSNVVKASYQEKIDTLKCIVSDFFDAKFCEMPMIDEGRTMSIALPNSRANSTQILKKITHHSNRDRLHAVLDSRRDTLVHIRMPAFKAKSFTDIRMILKKTNTATSILNDETAQYYKLFDENRPAGLSLGMHYVGFEFTGQGGQVENTLKTPEMTFYCDHPFLIMVSADGLCLLTGLIKNPNET